MILINSRIDSNHLWRLIGTVVASVAVLLLTGCVGPMAKTAPEIAPTSFISPDAPATMPEVPITALPQPLATPNVKGEGVAGKASVAAASQLASLGGRAPVIRANSSIKPGEVLSVAALLGTVDGKPLFVHDILGPIAGELRQEAAASRTRSFFVQQAARTVSRELQVKVDNLLMLQSAKHQLSKDDLKRAQMYVDMKKAKLVAQYMGSAEVADRALRLQGSSLAQKLRYYRDNFIVRYYMSAQLAPHLVVTRRQMWHYYQKHLKTYTRHAQADLYTITYPVIRKWPRDPADPTGARPIAHPTKAELVQAQNEAMAYCRQLESRIRKGANFAFLAEDNSIDGQAGNGGHWGMVRRGELSNAMIAKVAFSLKAGQMAPPMLVVHKHHPRKDVVEIIRVKRVQKHSVVPFGKAQIAIEKKLRHRAFRRTMAAYYKRMYDAASIQARADMVLTATNVATALYFHK